MSSFVSLVGIVAASFLIVLPVAAANFTGPGSAPPVSNVGGVFYVTEDANFTLVPDINKNLIVPSGLKVGQNTTLSRNASVGMDLAVNGQTSLKGVDITGLTVINGNINANGTFNFGPTVNTGNTNVSYLNVTGASMHRNGIDVTGFANFTGNTNHIGDVIAQGYFNVSLNARIGNMLSVGRVGNVDGPNVYGTNLWVENNAHVQGYELSYKGNGARSRLRVGTAWGMPGVYAENDSNNTTSDLAIGASSGVVRIGNGSNNSLMLGGVARSTWPSMQTTQVVWAPGNRWDGGFQEWISCPAGYTLTGWSAHGCTGNWVEWCKYSQESGNSIRVYSETWGAWNPVMAATLYCVQPI